MAEPIKITLENPIVIGSTTISELTVRPVKAKDLRRVKTPQELPLAMTVEVACFLTGQTSQVIDELEGNDLAMVLEAVTNFLDAIQPTGSEPSQ